MERLHEHGDVTWACEVTAAGRATEGEVGARAPTEQPSGLAGILGALGPGTSISFTLGARVMPEGVAVSCRVSGTGRSSTDETPGQQRQRMIEAIRIALTPGTDVYHLTQVDSPCEDPTTVNSMPYEAMLVPPSLVFALTDRPQIGFSPAGNCREGLRILMTPEPSAGSQQSFDGVMRVAEQYGVNLNITVEFESRELTHRESQALSQLLALVRKGNVRLEVSQSASWGEYVLSDQDWQGLAETLERWIRFGSGYRVTCRVTSDGPIDTALLTVLTGTVFPGFDRWRLASTGGRSESAPVSEPGQVVDLAACMPSPLGIAVPLPSARSLNDRGVPRIVSGPDMPLPASGVVLGSVPGPRGSRPVRLTPDDRMRHCYVTGATGTGKSTLLYSGICQDINSGNGVVVLDPHGDLFHAVLASIPGERADDVVVVDLADQEWAVGINFLECSGPGRNAQMTFVTNELVKIFDRLYDLKVTGGPMFETYFRNALMLIMDSSRTDGTLMDVPRIFEDEEFREHLKGLCTNKVVERFWSRQAERAKGEVALPNIAPYITCKLNQFTTNAMVTPIIGQATSTIRFRELMDSRRIVLINIPLGLLGELNTQLLGMLLIGKLYSAAMGRASVPAADRVPCYVYIDEFQLFATSTAAHVLAGARKFGISLTLANQNLSQLVSGSGSDNLLEATLGNCGSMVCFRLGVSDAERLEKYMRPELTARDLQMLPNFRAATRLLAHNVPTRPFVLATTPQTIPTNAVSVPGLIDRSRQQFCRRINPARPEACLQAQATEATEAETQKSVVELASRHNDESESSAPGDEDVRSVA